MPATLTVHESDPVDRIYELAGNLNEVEVFNNKVLIAVYQRPDETMTSGGILLTHKTTGEDRYQSKVGLIISMGPIAFLDKAEKGWFVDQDDMEEGDWVMYRPSDGWSLTLISRDNNGKRQELLCRLMDDLSIMGRIKSPLGPERVY